MTKPAHTRPCRTAPATAAITQFLRRLAVGLGVFMGGLITGPVMAQDATQNAVAGPPSAIDFYRHPQMGQVRLSPTGRRLALALSAGERVALAVLDLEGGSPPKVVAHYSDADVRNFAWVGEDRLIYSLINLQRGSGDQDFAPGLFAVRADGSSQRALVNTRNDFVRVATNIRNRALEWNHILLHVPETEDADANEIIVGKMSFNNLGELTAVVPMRLNVDNVSLQSLGEGIPDHAARWLFNRRGQPRVVSTLSQQGKVSVFRRTADDQDWKLLATMPAQARSWIPEDIDESDGLYVSVPEGPAGTSVLKRFDFKTGKPATESLVSTPGFDFNGDLIHDRTGAVLGMRVTTDALATVWFDKRLAAWQAEADKALPGRINRIDCRRCRDNDPVLLINSWSDRHPGELFILRPTRTTARWDRIGALRKEIDPRHMATLDLHRVATRDGLEIPVWITLPTPVAADPAASASKSAPRPAVVLVHGGPWANSGAWHWRADAQFLASRGYVVIEPEFRGSTGFGARHFRAGFKQWGLAMQDDVADALKWAVEKGMVDPKRVCIAGASYGGYAALMGPIRYPDLYRCAVSWVGVSEPALMMQSSGWSDFSDEARRFSWPELVGDPVKDAALLADASALRQAKRLKIPVLMAYGALDRRVPLEQGERMRAALTDAGNAPEWVVYPEEGHGWLREANRVDFARRMETFLARHLK